MKRNRRKNRNRKSHNRIGMTLVLTAVFMLFITLAIKSYGLYEKNSDYKETEQKLEEEIKDENDRTEELENLKKYMQTKKYVEEVAKDKLGLVYKDEIIFKSEN